MAGKDVWRCRVGRLARSAIRGLLGSIAVVMVTAACHQIHANFAIASFVYLLIVILQSLAGDVVSSVVVSLIAVASLDYFFVDPLYTLMVARGVDGVALLSFLTTALVITHLVLRARAQARSADRERERVDRLYRLSQQLLAMKPEEVGAIKFLERFSGVFGSTAVCIFDADTAELHLVGSSEKSLPDRTRDAYVSGKDTASTDGCITVRLLQIAGRITGAIGFEGLEEPGLTSGPLAILTAMLLDRTRALRQASDAAAAARAEVYRSAILDALAHEFKTPLATILAAAGGISQAASLTPTQSEMAELVETEAARLGSLTSRLLRLARLDREEVRPRMEVIDLNAMLAQLVDQQARRSPDHSFRLETGREGIETCADLELLRLAVGQLLENAAKYSAPGSKVEIRLETRLERIVIRVSNSGSIISQCDQRRIFERFYRGTDATHLAPGSGLGLYVARKIAVAHGGGLDLEDLPQTQGEVAFRLTIPRLQTNYVATSH